MLKNDCLWNCTYVEANLKESLPKPSDITKDSKIKFQKSHGHTAELLKIERPTVFVGIRLTQNAEREYFKTSIREREAIKSIILYVTTSVDMKFLHLPRVRWFNRFSFGLKIDVLSAHTEIS